MFRYFHDTHNSTMSTTTMEPFRFSLAPLAHAWPVRRDPLCAGHARERIVRRSLAGGGIVECPRADCRPLMTLVDGVSLSPALYSLPPLTPSVLNLSSLLPPTLRSLVHIPPREYVGAHHPPFLSVAPSSARSIHVHPCRSLIVFFPGHPSAHTPSTMDDRVVPEWNPSPCTTSNDSRAVPESSAVAVPALFFSPPLPHYFFSPARPVESCVVSSSSWTPGAAAPKRQCESSEDGPPPPKRQRRTSDGRGVKAPVEVVSKDAP